MTRKIGLRDIRQPKTQNETPQKKPKMGESCGRSAEARAHPLQDRAAEPEQGQRQEEPGQRQEEPRREEAETPHETPQDPCEEIGMSRHTDYGWGYGT